MNEIIVSIHIPKTGGVTFKNILSSIYGEECIWLTQTNSARLAFERLMTFNLDKVKCIHGHIGYGIHKYLKPLGISCKYITFVRNPIERMLSYHNYLLTEPVNAEYKWDEIFGWSSETSFTDWLNNKQIADQDNGMVRFLSGCENLNTDNIKYRMKDSDYQLAIENIKNFFFIGNTENFDTSIRAVALLLGWNSIPEYGMDNSHPNHRHMKDLQSLEFETVDTTQTYDMELWKILNETRSIC